MWNVNSDEYLGDVFEGDFELIETLWNVNAYKAITDTNIQPELIETLWNVNLPGGTTCLTPVRELIETLWNVNDSTRIIGRYNKL